MIEITRMPSPEEKALQNPLILQEILKYCTRNAKTLRLVSPLWNEVLLSSPTEADKLVLHLAKDWSKSVLHFLHFFSTNPNFDLRLAKSVQISLPSLLQPGVVQFGSKIGNLTLLLPLPEWMPHLEVILREEGLPNLTCLTLENTSLDSNGQSGIWEGSNYEEPPSEPLLLRPSLKSLRVRYIPEGCGCGSFVQLLVNCAPGLQTLEIVGRVGNVYPDLSRVSSTLRSLSYTGDLGSNLDSRNSSLMLWHISRMVGQVSESLQRLELDGIGPFTKWSMNNCSVFELPDKMPNLVEFINKRFEVFRCGKDLMKLQLESMPKLASLQFPKQAFESRGSLHDLVVGLVDGDRDTFASVRKLGMILSPRAGGGPAFLSRLKVPFQNLEGLSIVLEKDSIASLAPPPRPQIPPNPYHDLDSFGDILRDFGTRSHSPSGQLPQGLGNWRVLPNVPNPPPPENQAQFPQPTQNSSIVDVDTTTAQLLEGVLQAAGTLQLKQLQITINYGVGFSAVAKCLGENCSGLKGLQCLRICFTTELMVGEGMCLNCLDEYLLPLKGLKSLSRVEFATFQASTNLSEERILDFGFCKNQQTSTLFLPVTISVTTCVCIFLYSAKLV